MIVEDARYRVPEERQEAFLADCARAAAVPARAPQCVDHELSRSVDEPDCWVLRITWTSADDHLQGLRGGDLFPEFLAAVRPWVGAIEEMRHHAPTAVRGTGGSAITEPQRRRWVALLLDSLDEAGLPDDPEFRAAFVGYVEWGTRLALANSRPGADVVREAPVPRWGRGIAPPWTG